MIHGAVLFEQARSGNDIGHLLTDGYIDAYNILILLIANGIQSDGCLTCLTVADYELSLASSDRSKRVDSSNSREQRCVDGCSFNDRRSGRFDRALLCISDDAFAVDRMAQSIYNSSQKAHAYRDRACGHGTCAAHALDNSVFTGKENDADPVLLKVHGYTGCT